jgi:uncharacterized membrane protein
MNERNSSLINGALIAIGVLGIVDNVIFHWVFQLHRVVPGPSAIIVEVMLVVASLVFFAAGIWRELRARQ